MQGFDLKLICEFEAAQFAQQGKNAVPRTLSNSVNTRRAPLPKKKLQLREKRVRDCLRGEKKCYEKKKTYCETKSRLRRKSWLLACKEVDRREQVAHCPLVTNS